MSVLWLVRHASAAPADEAGDRERPLDAGGRRDAQALAAWATTHRLAPDLVLCSAAYRTRQTLEILAPSFVQPAETSIEDGLYLAPARRLLNRLRQVPADKARVLLIGHNPGLHEFASFLSDVASGPLATRIAAGFPAAALAQYDVEVSWRALDGQRARLVAFVTPKELIRGPG